MKKCVALILLFTILLSLFACSNKSDPDNDPPATDTQAEAEEMLEPTVTATEEQKPEKYEGPISEVAYKSFVGITEVTDVSEIETKIVDILNSGEWYDGVFDCDFDCDFTLGGRMMSYSTYSGIFQDSEKRISLVLSDEVANELNKYFRLAEPIGLDGVANGTFEILEKTEPNVLVAKVKSLSIPVEQINEGDSVHIVLYTGIEEWAVGELIAVEFNIIEIPVDTAKPIRISPDKIEAEIPVE